MKKLLLLVLLLGSFAAFSQGTISGNVTDSALGSPLSGANIVEAGGTSGAITDFDGKFSLEVNSNSGTVTVSYLGYTNQEVSYTLTGGTADLGSISLVTDANALDEVVVSKARQGVKKMMVFSPAFVADCLETTIEIGIEFQELFKANGGEGLQLVENLNDHPLWVDTLADIVSQAVNKENQNGAITQ